MKENKLYTWDLKNIRNLDKEALSIITHTHTQTHTHTYIYIVVFYFIFGGLHCHFNYLDP